MTTNEYRKLTRMGPEEILALSARLRNGDPEDVKAYLFASVWKNILVDPFIPQKEKKKTFFNLCRKTEIEVVHG